jgi:putative tricarboxylic transport membrane protein
MFAGIFYGAMYGGSTTSILLNTPGESGSMMTALEGNKMARKGRGAAALCTAAIGSFVAGTIGTLGITFLAPPIAELAFIFKPQDYFALMLLAFLSVSVVMGTSKVRGFIALFLGLSLGVVGIDKQTGLQRLTFDVPDLMDGVEMTVVLVSLFAIGETLYVASRFGLHKPNLNPLAGGIWMTKDDWKRSWKPWLRGTAFRSARCRPAVRKSRLSSPIRSSVTSANIRKSSAMVPSRAWPAPRLRTTPPPQACWCRC